jgi:hypothetical protein
MASRVGVAERDAGQAQQRPRVVAQPAGGVRSEGVGDAGGEFGLQTRTHQQLDDLVGGLRGQEAGEQPFGRCRPTRGSLMSRSAVTSSGR